VLCMKGRGREVVAQVAQMIRTYTEECLVFEKFRSDPVSRPTRPKWSKPPEGFAKLNSILLVLTLR
jgi:hypothetical protein